MVDLANRGASGAMAKLSDATVQLTIAAGHWELKWSQLTFVKLLGSGQFGEVQLMQLRTTAKSQRLVAVKTLIDEVHFFEEELGEGDCGERN